MFPKRLFVASAIALAWHTTAASAQDMTLPSPDGALKFELKFDASTGKITYEINDRERPVILPSALGISGYTDNIESIELLEPESVDTTWRPVYGERAVVRDRYNQQTVSLKAKGRKERLDLIVRAYDEGIAFRYAYTGNGNVRIEDEATIFRVPERSECWFAPYAQAVHTRMPVQDWPGEAERPLTLRLGEGHYAALCEAEVVNYCRTKFFVEKGEPNVIRCRMYDTVEDFAPLATPWRLVMVADSPAELLQNNDIILNLNTPCRIAETSWIKPGKIMRVTRLTTEAAKEVVDFAAERGLEYIHFDAGWYGREASKESDPRKPIPSLDMPEIVKYAKSKGIGVWLYVNQRALTNYLEEILPLYESWGIAGIKFGFVHVGSYRWTAWLHDAVSRCAKYHLMVDIHDEYRPTGYSRTYPNLLTQEGVRGNEEFPDGTVNTTQPFTRFLAGAADATVCYYHRPELKPDLASSLNARYLKNTPVHQMALAAINYSPLQFLYWYDSPQNAQNEPELSFFDALPTVWDDTRVLSGEIGEHVAIARKKDGVWFVAAITNNDARTLSIGMDFLDAGKKYVSTIYTDGGEKVKTRTHVALKDKRVTSESVLTFDLLPRGGVVMIIREKQ
ncbi:MAG TPA: glycoside hydrolase family 97 protein [Candidatus Alistipes intestinipullorum]|nr:glycoside hydrolase family 97 protein [Candidatus Alistipes intestinipullorum]